MDSHDRQESERAEPAARRRRSGRLMRSNLPIARSDQALRRVGFVRRPLAHRERARESQGAGSVRQAGRHHSQQHGHQHPHAGAECADAQEGSAQREDRPGHPRREGNHEPLRISPARRRDFRGGRTGPLRPGHRQPSGWRSRRPRAVHVRVAPRHLRERTHLHPDGPEQHHRVRQLQRHVLRQLQRRHAR